MRKLFLTLHILIAIGLLVTGYSDRLAPGTWRYISLLGYIFPLFLVLSIVSLAVAACRYRRHLVVPFAALVAAYGPVSLYSPVHREQAVPQEALTIMTYNTHSWGLSDYDETQPDQADGGRAIMRYIADSEADIVCLQESTPSPFLKASLDSIMHPIYPYHETAGPQGTGLCIYSRHPIKRSQTIDYESENNGSAAFWIDINGREVVVVNNHLQTTGLSIEDRHKFADMVHGRNDTIEDISRSIFSKLLQSTITRVPQAEAVADFVRQQLAGHRPVIVCGDFNDIPNSYVHRIMARDLTDCYQSTALGPGYSFSRYGMRVRIDNVLCSPDITPYNFHTDNYITVSDHYPVKGQLLIGR